MRSQAGWLFALSARIDRATSNCDQSGSCCGPVPVSVQVRLVLGSTSGPRPARTRRTALRVAVDGSISGDSVPGSAGSEDGGAALAGGAVDDDEAPLPVCAGLLASASSSSERPSLPVELTPGWCCVLFILAGCRGARGACPWRVVPSLVSTVGIRHLSSRVCSVLLLFFPWLQALHPKIIVLTRWYLQYLGSRE